jgi:dipeptidyl aminopeptidase/acylaminoacyl peptidase
MPSRLIACLLTGLSAAMGGSVLAAPVPLKDALAAPITQELATASRATTLAWVVRTAGRFEIRVAGGPTIAPKTLVAGASENDLPLSDLTLSPDGRLLAYVQGESGAPSGRIPNPASLADGVTRRTFLIATAGGAPVEVANVADGVSFTPDGRAIAWSDEGALKTATILTGGDGRIGIGEPRTLFRDIGTIDDFSWSPDGAAIAFVSQRSGHGIIGVYRTGQARITWLGPSFESDTALAWSPDSRKVAFVRLQSRDYGRPYDVMTDHAFEILSADASTGEARVLFRSAGADGSAIMDGPLLWTAADEILFLSDESGFSQLYAEPAAGGAPRRLSRGDCDLEAVSLDAMGRLATLVGNCVDQTRRDVSILDLTSGVDRVVSRTGTIADSSSFIGQTADVAYRSADAVTPQTPAVASVNHIERRIDAPTLGPAIQSFRAPEVVQFQAADGHRVTGTLFRPSHPVQRRGPAIVFVHGGPIRQMMPGWHVSLYYALAYANNQHLADAGFTVLSVNYRLGVGFGRDFRNTPGYGPHGQRELQDVVAAGQFLQSKSWVDPKSIGVYGGSVGGYLTAAALSRHSDLFAAGVAWSGIYDWSKWVTNPSRDMIFTSWGIGPETIEQARASSPLYQVDTWTSPTLLVAGDDDRNVYFPEAIRLAHALQDKGVDIETLLIPNGIHPFGSQENWLKVFQATDDFFAGKLIAAKAAVP